VVVAVLFNAGLHVPLMPLVDVVGNGLKVAPEQIAGTAVKVGVTFALTVMTIDEVAAHCAGLGVKMYVVVPAVDVLIVAGFQVPNMPLSERVGNAGGVAFWQNGPMAVNVGVTCAVISIFIVTDVAHCAGLGVNV